MKAHYKLGDCVYCYTALNGGAIYKGIIGYVPRMRGANYYYVNLQLKREKRVVYVDVAERNMASTLEELTLKLHQRIDNVVEAYYAEENEQNLYED